MKRTIAASAMLTLTVIFAFLSGIYIKNTCSSLISGIDEISQQALTQNAEEVNRLTVLLNSAWEKKDFFMKFLLGQDKAASLQTSFENIIFFAKIKNFDALLLSLTDLRGEICRIKESYEPDLQIALRPAIIC